VQIQVRAVEEPHLARVHDEFYATYVAGSGRFLPKLLLTATRRTG
jgi:hypothetical protein